MSLRGRHDSKGQGKKSQREDSPKVHSPQESTLIAARLGPASITTPGHPEAMANYSNELPIGNSSLSISAHISPFEAIKRTDENGNEFWRSREFARTLSYNDYTNFENVINKAKTACLNSGHLVEDHFRDVTEMIRIGKGGQRPFEGCWLSRYACYLIIQNADPAKDIVALGQTYFAVQTRRQ